MVGHPLMPNVCLPEFPLCVTDAKITYSRRPCPHVTQISILSIKTGIMVTDYRSGVSLHTPQNLDMHFERCRMKGGAVRIH